MLVENEADEGWRWEGRGPCVALSPSECLVSAETPLVTDELHIPAVTPESRGAFGEPIPKQGKTLLMFFVGMTGFKSFWATRKTDTLLHPSPCVMAKTNLAQ